MPVGSRDYAVKKSYPIMYLRGTEDDLSYYLTLYKIKNGSFFFLSTKEIKENERSRRLKTYELSEILTEEICENIKHYLHYEKRLAKSLSNSPKLSNLIDLVKRK